MTGVEKLFIYWPERHNLGPGRKFRQIYWPGKPPGCISPGHLDRVYTGSTYTLANYFQFFIGKVALKDNSANINIFSEGN